MAKRRPAGDGMVRKREDGRWEGRIVVGHKSNGDSIFRYISAPTQKELSAKLRQLTEAYKGVDLTEESNMALSVWLDKWLDEYMAATLRPTTLNGYRRSLELHVKPYLGNKTLSKITAVDLRSLYRTLQETGRVHPRDGQSPGLSARTVHGIHTTLHHALKTAMEQNLIPNNPAAEVDPPKFDGAPMKILTEAQLDAFMKVIEKDAFWHDFFYTAVTTGLRRGEICALRWEDFDTKQETLHVRRTLHKEKGKPLTTGDTKTYAGTRKIVLPPSTAQLLRERKKTAPTEWIFPNPFDPEQPIAPGTAYNRLKALLKETGLPDIRFHDLRHTFATHALFAASRPITRSIWSCRESSLARITASPATRTAPLIFSPPCSFPSCLSVWFVMRMSIVPAGCFRSLFMYSAKNCVPAASFPTCQERFRSSAPETYPCLVCFRI